MNEADEMAKMERIIDLDRKAAEINKTMRVIGLPYGSSEIDARALYFQTEEEARTFDELFEPKEGTAVAAYRKSGAGWYTYIVSYEEPQILAVRKWQDLMNLCHSLVDDWARVQEKQMRDTQSKLKISDWSHNL